jgi:hypothetical protein
MRRDSRVNTDKMLSSLGSVNIEYQVYKPLRRHERS